MAQIDRVAAAGGVEIVALVLAQHVVAGIVDAAEGERRTEVVALGGVVVDDVENDLDAGRVQPADHQLEFVDVAAGRDVARRRREEVGGVVAPVVDEPALDEIAIVEEGLDRHQFDGGDAELLEMLDHARIAKARERPAQWRRDILADRGHALDVRLIDDRFGPRAPGVAVAAPGDGSIDDLTHFGMTNAELRRSMTRSARGEPTR